MAGFLLTGGGVGCPPTATPPAGYQNPFRFDGAGRLWINQCFSGFKYFGAARHDLLGAVVPGDGSAPVSTAPDIVSGAPMTAGVFTTRTITNTTSCTLGILLAHDVIVDALFHRDNYAFVTVSERWNGANHASATVSGQHDPFGGAGFIRQLLHSGANPHDQGADPTGGSTLQLAPGASATVGARLYIAYPIGAPVPGEIIYGANTAVRIYGYVLG